MKPLTPPVVAGLLGVNVRKVLLWIDRAELHAINVAADPKTRPRWVITPEAFEAFKRRRSNEATAAAAQPRRRRKMPKKDFFPEV